MPERSAYNRCIDRDQKRCYIQLYTGKEAPLRQLLQEQLLQGWFLLLGPPGLLPWEILPAPVRRQ